MTRPTFKQFRSKALKKPGVQKSYEDLEVAYELRKQLIALRQKAGLTQEDVAKKLRTSKGNISRLENVHSSISPKLSTIQAYAEAIGYKLKIDFVRRVKRQRKKLVQSDDQPVGR
jgi:transcriptional regulator with XRE-family HTH domain